MIFRAVYSLAVLLVDPDPQVDVDDSGGEVGKAVDYLIISLFM